MTPNVYLLVDSRGWPNPLKPDTLSDMLQAKIRAPLDVRALRTGGSWADQLPSEPCVTLALLTAPPDEGWLETLQSWVDSAHMFYVMYTDGFDPQDVLQIAQLTAAQAVPRAPYRIAQYTSASLEHTMDWAVAIVQKTATLVPVAPTPRYTAARWRNLPSSTADDYYFPEEYTTSTAGADGYRLVAASHRGKTHAHNGTFREDAVAVASTPYWNIMAVADGAGTAELARVGSNLAVTKAVRAMIDAMPDPPDVEDISRAIWAGLRAAYQEVRSFAGERALNVSALSTTLQLLIHCPQASGCLLGVAHVGDGIVTAETPDGQFYLLTEPDTDPDDSSRTMFLTSGPLRQWMERTRVYQFDDPLDIVAMMTDGLSGDLEPYGDLLRTNLFTPLRRRVLIYPLKQRERALLAMIGYDRRGSFDDRTLAVLSRQ